MNCVFCHKEQLVTDIVYEDEKGNGFGWTYGDEAKEVTSEIAKVIKETIDVIQNFM